VIARNSTFTYKGKPVKVKRVAEEFGVQYVLEGSVQRSGDRIRITAQLIDALNARHLWSERYDRELKDIYALQDDIAMEILRALRVKLTAGEGAAFRLKYEPDIDVYLKYLQAREYSLTYAQEDNIKARKMAEEVISLDPKYAGGYVRLALVELNDVWQGISKSPKESLIRGVDLAKKSIEIEDNPDAHSLLANIYFLRRKWDEAIVEGKKAIEMVPNGAGAHISLGIALAFADRGQEAIPILEKGIRLSPYPDTNYLHSLAFAYFLAEKYEEAIEAARQAVRIQPNNPIARRGLAAYYYMSGREEEARAEALKAIRIDPNWSISEAQSRVGVGIKNKHQAKKYYDALRKAGIPEHPPLPLPDKPSIAVLPFVNMSGDPEQETPKMFVIARTSSFKYKGKEVDIRTVGRELGVRYVLEGSLRKSQDQLRITAKLVDAKTGNHLWAERYDRDLKDIFALYDEITMKIITAMQVELTEGEQIRIWAKGTENLDAYLKFLESGGYYSRFNKESIARARQLAGEAIALDPQYALAYGRLGFTHWADLIMNWSESRSESFKQLTKSAQKGLALDESEPLLHALQSQIYLIEKQFEKALSEGEKAVSLSPSYFDAYVYLSHTLRFLGKPEEAIVVLKKAIRLNPFPSVNYYHNLGFSYLFAGMAKEALATYQKAIKMEPNNLPVNLGLAVTYSALGQEEEARAVGENILKINPKFSVEKFAKRLPYKNEAYRDLLISGLKKAGLK
jgi:TolB-like protein/Tfp pilus assembly protein PilF